MRKRSRKDCDVAGSPRTKIQGINNVNLSINNVPDPSNNMQDGVSMRNADDNGEMPRKRLRSSNLNDPVKNGKGSVEATSIKRGARKASVDAGTPEKKIRCSTNNTNTTEPSVTLVGEHLVELKKRKDIDDNDDDDDDDNEAPEKKRRCSDGSSSVKEEDVSSDDDEDDMSQDFSGVSTKEEKIYQMSSSGKRSGAGFEKKYCQLDPLGNGGFGSVCAGFRKSDNLPVAIKHIPSEAVRCEEVMILKQLVDAAIDMHSKGVFHRDIKLHNVLIQLDSDVPRVRITDFGCGTFSTNTAHSSLCGTTAIYPPEWFDSESYWACPTTVWQLGALFYSLLNGHEPLTTKGFIKNHIQINCALSTQVKTLLSMYLTRKLSFRITLESLQHNFVLRQL